MLFGVGPDQVSVYIPFYDDQSGTIFVNRPCYIGQDWTVL